MNPEARASRHPTLAECAARARVGLRTLTRCLRGERVDRRSIELIFAGVGLELESADLLPGHFDPRSISQHGNDRTNETSPATTGSESYA